MSKLIGLAAAIVIRLLRVTLRVRHVRVENIERQPQCIQAFWHETIVMMLFSRFHRPITVMSSQSRDGDIAVFVYWTFGVRSIRGSSRRGGNAAMREVVRAARGGSNIAMTPDGPTGPPRIAKDGVIFAARMSGLPIIPVTFAAKRTKRLRSWDRMIVPLPFSRAIFLYGEPLAIARDDDGEEARKKLEMAMNELADEAETNFEVLWRSV